MFWGSVNSERCLPLKVRAEELSVEAGTLPSRAASSSDSNTPLVDLFFLLVLPTVESASSGGGEVATETLEADAELTRTRSAGARLLHRLLGLLERGLEVAFVTLEAGRRFAHLGERGVVLDLLSLDVGVEAVELVLVRLCGGDGVGMSARETLDVGVGLLSESGDGRDLRPELLKLDLKIPVHLFVGVWLNEEAQHQVWENER